MPSSYPSLLTCHRIFGSQIMAIKGSHKQWKITHAIICNLVSLTFMSNIKAILKFYVRQMWQGTQQATTNHSLPMNERKKRLVEERLTVGEKEKQLSLCWQSHCMQACILDQVNQIPEQIANMETIWSNNSLGRKDSISILTLPRIIWIQIKAVSWET